MKKILIVCSLLLAPVALFFLSGSSNNLSELGLQNVEALSSGENNEIPPYPDFALLPIPKDTTRIFDITVGGQADLLPKWKLFDSSLEVNCQYNIVFTGFGCYDAHPGCYCNYKDQKITIVGIVFKKRNVKP